MKFVDPIENDNDVVLMYHWMMRQGHFREACAFIIGCNVALRVSDLLELKFSDIDTSAEIKEIKTKKSKTVTFNQTVLDHVEKLREWYPTKYINPTYLFESISKQCKKIQPISPSWLNRVLTDAAEAINLDYNVGTHSMRKTWGYRAYKSGMDIRQIQKIFNHSSEAVTLSYIGITKRRIEQAYHDNELKIA